MGRVTAERQCFTGGCSIGTNYKLTHSYDLAGDTIGSNNGITGTNAVSLSDNYDQAGHLESVTSSLNDAMHPSTLFQATGFNAFALTGANYAVPNGSGTPGFSQTLNYDVRMRLDGETDTATNPSASLYSYSVGRDLAGNVTALTGDMEMGTWGYSYDALNRLQAATATVGGYPYSGLTLTEAYDSFGNRESQVASGSYKGTVPQPSPVTFTHSNNRVDQWSYDAAGDVVNDGTNMYEYDAEGRQTGTLNALTGLTGYVYDAEGRWVMKIVVEGWNTPHPEGVVEDEYLLGLNGEQVTVLGPYGAWQWTNVYAGGRQLATYDSAGTHFALTDWLVAHSSPILA